MVHRRRVACVFAVAFCVAGWRRGLHADVKLAGIFGDHMVLQQGIMDPVWGWADPGERVTVRAGDATASATAGPDGKWSVALDALKPSFQPIELTVSGKNSVTIHDVLIGDNWICSGQSNMEFDFGSANNFSTENAKSDHPDIREFNVVHKIAFQPESDCQGKWVVCSPRTARPFSAVGYFFGRDIEAAEHVPVGLIGTYWGGTPIQSWTSLEALEAQPNLLGLARQFENTRDNLTALTATYENVDLPAWQKHHDAWITNVKQPYMAAMNQWQIDSAKAKAQGQPAPTQPAEPREPNKPVAPGANPYLPTVLSNGMISPLLPFAIKGAIWYQGEANVGDPMLYRTQFSTMIGDWRSRWGEGNFPFLWVQLANFTARLPEPTQSSGSWPGLREAQSMTLKLTNTAQAVIIDIGQGDSIHPKDKMDVGKRLALAARHVAYGEQLVYSGPTFASMKVESDSIRVSFDNLGSGLTILAPPATQPSIPQAAPASAVEGFSIAGVDKHFVWADAKIDGDTIVVSSPNVKNPVAVRYGWANNPAVNLYNREGLPASPFRTDTW